jgi:hypothetical protein
MIGTNVILYSFVILYPWVREGEKLRENEGIPISITLKLEGELEDRILQYSFRKYFLP